MKASKKIEAPTDLDGWTPTARIDALSFEIVMIRIARTFWGGEPAPVTQKENIIKDEFNSYPVDEREDSLKRVLNYTIGGILVPLKEQIIEERAQRSRAIVKEAFAV